MQTQYNNLKAGTTGKNKITEITIKNVFNKNSNPLANNCQLNPGLCILINKAS